MRRASEVDRKVLTKKGFAIWFVMPGLVPGIHVLAATSKKDVDGRDEPGHDGILQSARGLLVGFRGPFRKRRERVVA
jgi:hypothetical protein